MNKENKYNIEKNSKINDEENIKNDDKNIKINSIITQNNENDEQNDNNSHAKMKLKRNKKRIIVKKKKKKIVNIRRVNTQINSNIMKDSYSQNELIVEQLNTFKRQKTIKINEVINERLNNPDLVEYYTLIKIDAYNNSKDKRPQESHYILNNYDYDLALQYEKRSFWRIFYIILIARDNTLNVFLFKSPLHIKYLRVALLILSFLTDGSLNSLFYFNDKISDNFHYIGDHEFWHSIRYDLMTIFVSTILGKVAIFILQFLTNSKSAIEEEFKKEEKKMREDNNYIVDDNRKLEIQRKINKIIKNLKIKIIIFLIIELIFILFNLYYVTAFCSVFPYTQINVYKDTISSFIISIPTSMAISLVMCTLYKISLKYKIKILYKIILFFV